MSNDAPVVETGENNNTQEYDLSDQDKREILMKRLKAASFAEIISLLMRSPKHRSMTLQQIEQLVVPAYMANQYSVAKARTPNRKLPVIPAGVALWAKVSDEIDQKLEAGPVELAPSDWTSGENLWVIEMVAQPQIGGALVKELQRTAFSGQSFKVSTIDKDGVRKVETVTAMAAE